MNTSEAKDSLPIQQKPSTTVSAQELAPVSLPTPSLSAKEFISTISSGYRRLGAEKIVELHPEISEVLPYLFRPENKLEFNNGVDLFLQFKLPPKADTNSLHSSDGSVAFFFEQDGSVTAYLSTITKWRDGDGRLTSGATIDLVNGIHERIEETGIHFPVSIQNFFAHVSIDASAGTDIWTDQHNGIRYTVMGDLLLNVRTKFTKTEDVIDFVKSLQALNL